MEDAVIASMSKEEKKWFALAIVGMIWADGKVDKAELAYLKSIIGVLGDKDLMGPMLAMVKKGKIPPLPDISMDQKKAAYILSQLTLLSTADEELAADEEAFLKLATEKLGYPANVSDRFLNHARKQLGANNYPALMSVGSTESKIWCSALMEHECIIFSTRAVNPFARVSFQFYRDRTGEDPKDLMAPIVAQSSWCRPVKSKYGEFKVKVEFQQKLREEQGLELMKNPEASREKAKKTLKATNKSLLGFYVQCRVCGKKNIPFWILRSNTINTRNNIFGIPVYHKAKEGKEFCDYNLVQVSVCPECLFASNQMGYFIKQQGETESEPFDSKAFKKHWDKGLPIREQLAGKNRDWLTTEKRTLRQAIAAYQLALATSDHMASIVNEEHALEYWRRSVSLLLIEADLAMSKGEGDYAKRVIKKAEKRLKKIFPQLSQVPAIRSAFILSMIKIYFKKYKEAGEYLNFLKDLYASRTIMAGSPEYKALNQAVNQSDKAWQDRAEYAYDTLPNFHIDWA